jgi:cell fate regulator YaaT (PSP1 superfamily)
MSKTQEEEKALALCQAKVRQKKLPMEVIDAEYQWCALRSRNLNTALMPHRDRRKLTFYFIAEKRIDFRELVRELFRSASLHGPPRLTH